LASSKISPRSSARNMPQLQHPLSGQLLPGQAEDEEDEANSDDEYVEAHSVAVGEVVTKPELEGPTVSDDENDITFETSGSATRSSVVGAAKKSNPIKSKIIEDHKANAAILDTKTTPVIVRGGTDTPSSNNSVSSVTSTHSSQPLLAGQSKLESGDGQ